MSQDEIRKLIGGYATGTLTESERKALFAAALDDQDLFDELAREQALKELLDSPGARTRLAGALAPKPVLTWWKKPLPWALAGMLLAGVVIGLVLVRGTRPQPIATIAQTESRPALDQASKSPLSEPSPAAVAPSNQILNQPVQVPKQTVSPAAPVPPPVLRMPEGAPEQPLKKGEKVRRDEAPKLDSVPTTLADKAVSAEKDSPQVQQAKAQAAPSQGAPSRIGGQQFGAANSAAPRPQAPSDALSSDPDPRVGRAFPAGALANRFALDYTIRHDSLTVNLLSAGYLEVTALVVGGQVVQLQSGSRQEPGTSVTIPVPANSTRVTVEYSARPPLRLNGLANVQKTLAREKTTASPVSPRVAPAVSSAATPSPTISTDKAGHLETTSPVEPRLSITLAVPAE